MTRVRTRARRRWQRGSGCCYLPCGPRRSDPGPTPWEGAISPFLVIGGLSPFGLALCRALLDAGHTVVSVDPRDDPRRHPSLLSVRVEPGDAQALASRVFRPRRFDTVFPCATPLCAGARPDAAAREAEVGLAREVAEACAKYGTDKVVLPTCGPEEGAGRDVEAAFAAALDPFRLVTLRMATVVGFGGADPLAPLFEGLAASAPLRMVGGFETPCQVLALEDAMNACLRASNFGGGGVFALASGGGIPFARAIEDLAVRVGSVTRPEEAGSLEVFLLRAAARVLGVHPLAAAPRLRDPRSAFDSVPAREKLGWEPSCDMVGALERAYAAWRVETRPPRTPLEMAAPGHDGDAGVPGSAVPVTRVPADDALASRAAAAVPLKERLARAMAWTL